MIDNLKHVEGRVVISIDIEKKNNHKFSDGTVIRLERDWNNLNRRYTQPVNANVISADNITKDAEILIHPNAIHESNRIYNFKKISGDFQGDIRYYSIPNEMCFAWHDGNDWQPIAPYEFGYNVYKPYTGVLEGIDPTQLTNTLFVLTGALKHEVVKTLKASDYVVIFQDKNGQENQLLRFRPFGDDKNGREPEAIAILHDDTKKVLNDEYLIGISNTSAKQYSKCFNQLNTTRQRNTDYSTIQ